MDCQVSGQVSIADAMGAVDKWLAGPDIPDRESWGTSPEAAAGQRAMMDLAGGPAPPRPAQERPKPDVSEAEPPGGDGPG